MYLNEVISDVRRVLPNEYTSREIYRWCDELSALLMREYKKVFQRVQLKSENGCFFLPDEACEVFAVIADGKEIPNRDLRTAGFSIEYTTDGYVLVDINDIPKNSITVIYQLSYIPVRYVDDTVTLLGLEDDEYGHRVRLSWPLDIRAGDTVDVAFDDTKYTLHILHMTADDDGQILMFKEDLPVLDGQYKEVKLTRHITEMTVCPAPYDSMYVDFCTMKIAWYQRNFSVYAYIKNAFSDKLLRYEKYLRRNAQKEPVTKLINYIN